jgi:hypothetical protein
MYRVADLKPHPENYRAHPPEQIEELRASLREFGIARNLVVSADGYVLAGHGVREAASAEGIEEVPGYPLPYPHDDPRARKFLVLDNTVSRMAEDDDKTLAALLASIQQTDEQGLAGTGYDDAGLDKMIGELAAEDHFTRSESAPQAGRDDCSAWGGEKLDRGQEAIKFSVVVPSGPEQDAMIDMLNTIETMGAVVTRA